MCFLFTHCSHSIFYCACASQTSAHTPAIQEAVNETTSIDSNIIFKVQIAAGSKKIETKPYNFKTLEDISREQEGNLYKYYYGSTHNYDEVMKLEKTAKSKGYKSSFIVAFKDGKRISLADALKTSAN